MSNEDKSADNWDKELAATLKRSLASNDEAPPFDAVFAASERRHNSSRRQFARFAGAAMVAAVAVTVLIIFNKGAQTPESEPWPELLQMAELMDSTAWSAPSDVLLPTHEFDIYQDLPVLLESTKPVEGALL